jgi:hypothetical protein
MLESSQTVDVLPPEHLAGARASVRNPQILNELEAETDADVTGSATSCSPDTFVLPFSSSPLTA